jgi:microcystin-dependent protein
MKFRLDPFAPNGVSLENSTTYVGGGASGVKSISKSGSAQLAGDITLSEGANVTLTQTGNNIQIASSGGGGGSSPLTTKGDVYTYSTADARLPVGANGEVLSADSSTATGLKWVSSGGTGTVTSVSVTTANGVSGSVATATTTPAISLTLGAITPSSVNSVVLSGASTPTLAVTGTSTVSGTNTGDQTTITGNAGTATTLQTARTIGTITGDATSAGSSFNGSANNTNALTLATVNSNVGSFTNTSLTVNGKGLITAASSGATPEVPLTFSTGLTRTVNTVTVNTSQNIATLSNLTSNGLVTTSGGVGTLSVTATTGSGNAVLATSPTLTAPRFASGGFIADANGNEEVIFTTTASAVNEITLTNAATGNAPNIKASGGDSNVGLKLQAKGTSNIDLLSGAGLNMATFASTASSVNYLQISPSTTTNPIAITATGTDTDISVNVVPKGIGRLQSGGVTVPTISSSDILTNKTFDSTSPTAFFYPGMVMPYVALTAPTGWLFAYGQAVSRSTYSALFSAIVSTVGTFTTTIASPAVATKTAHPFRTGDQVYLTTTGALPTGLTANTIYYVHVIDANTFHFSTTQANSFASTYITTTGTQSGTHTIVYCPYGLGDGSTTFNIPDLRGRVVAGKDDMGGTPANLLTLAQTQGVRGYNLGNTGGEQGHQITTAELASHAHSTAPTTSDGNVVGGGAGGAGANITQGGGAFRTYNAVNGGSTGSDTAHNNIQPTLIVNYIIKI